MKIFIIVIGIVLCFPQTDLHSQVFLDEGFEDGYKPEGWTQEYMTGAVEWRYRNGGYNPSDPNLDNPITPSGDVDIARNPPEAYEGNYNAFFFNQGDDNERTKLITPGMNIMGATAVELSFYLCQIPWTFEGSNGWDILRVYYKVSSSDPWILLEEFLDPVYNWEEQRINLPNTSETYYVAFEGHTRWGFGSCIDNVHIEETGSQQLYVADIEFEQPFSQEVPSGTSDAPIIRADVKVYGNSGSLTLDQITFFGLNSSDADLSNNGVKLYSTSTQLFSTDNLLGSPVNFSSGLATFTGLSHNLSPGHTYLWLTYDVALDATHRNRLDAMVQANQIVTSSGTYPAIDNSPTGDRTIYQTRYYDDFEGSLNWTLTGEFQVGTPDGNGGNPGNPNPLGAHSGTNALGTDLTGLGANLFNYESGLSQSTAYLATSETFNLLYYKDLTLFFWRHLNIEVWDRAMIEISTDDGATWNLIWESNAYINDFQWDQHKVAIPLQYWRSEQIKIRFGLGPTNGADNYSGWNIDDVYLTGEFISKDVGVSQWIYPQSGSGHTSNDSVTVLIRNYGGAAITDPVPVAYSFNGGSTWTINQMDSDIPVDGSVEFTFPSRTDLSQPGLRPSVIARTIMPGDQYSGNDQITTEIYIVPTYITPYEEDFEENDGYWRSPGAGLWEYGTPAGGTIIGSASASKSWATGLSSTYGDMISDANQVIFTDGFETDLGWSFDGEFERAIPHGEHLPWYAGNGYYCAGIDLGLAGLGDFQYENGITAGTAYTATSPPLDVSNYSNLEISFLSWVTVQAGDSLRLEISPDGLSWHTIWKNDGTEILDTWYQEVLYAIPEELTFTNEMRIRYSLYYSSPSGEVAQGWSIDDVLVTGDLVSDKPGYFYSPSIDFTGIQNPMIAANLWIETEPDTDGVNLQYSLDDGENWTTVSNVSGNDAYWNWYTDQPVTALVSNGWSGHTAGWIPVKHRLPVSLAGEGNVQFRFNFAANKTDNKYDGIAIDDVRIMEAPPDIDLLDIIYPVSSCVLSSEQTFTLSMRNAGIATIQAGDSIQIGYVIDRSGDIQLAEETFVLTAAWSVGSTVNHSMTAPFDFSYSGDYEVTVYNISPDPHFYNAVSGDTVVRNIAVNKPHVALGEDISTSIPDTILLKAYSGVPGQSYVWQDLSADSIFHVDLEGKYYVRVSNLLGCTASDTISVLKLAADLGVTSYRGPQSSCELGDSLPLEIRIENLGTDTLMAGDSIFIGGVINSGSPFEDTLVLASRFFPHETIDHIYSESFDFSSPGDYQMKLYTRIKNDTEPLNDTLIHTLQVFGYPDADLGPDRVVTASGYLLAPAAGYAVYVWQDGSTAETFLVDEPGIGMYHVTISDANQCTDQDTVTITLNIPDLELEQLLSPATSCVLSSSITIAARIRNSGNQIIPSGETLNMGYQVDGGSIVTDQIVLTTNFLPGHSLDFTFSNSEPLVTGNWYDFIVFVDYSLDVERENDTITTSVGVFETPVLDLGDPYQLILGFEHTLDAGAGFVSYEWQDASTNQTYTISEPGIGHYSVTVTDLNGCTGYDEADIMLVTPDIGILEISHPVTTCHLENDEHIKVAIQNFGNWDIESSASITVSYSVNGSVEVTEDVVLDEVFESGTIIYHTFTEAVDFSEPGLYNIMAFTTYGPDLIESNNLALVSVDHYGSPIVDIGNGSDTLLVDSPITLYATIGYPYYEWQNGSTETEYYIGAPSAGWYKVIVTGDNGCETHDSVYVVYDYPDLAISQLVSPASLCSQAGLSTISIEITNLGYYRIAIEDTLTISYSVDGGAPEAEMIFLQSNLPPGQPRVLSFSTGYDFSMPGAYSVQTSVIYGPDLNLSNNTLITGIQSWELPMVDIGNGQDTLLTDLPVTLEAGSGFSSYLWQDLSTSESYSATEAGLYQVTVSNSNGCFRSDSVYVSSLTAISADESPGEVKIYPNPVRDVLHVELEMSVAKDVVIELYSMSNVLVYKGDLRQSNVAEEHINVAGMAPGVYAIRITAGQVPYNFLVVVE